MKNIWKNFWNSDEKENNNCNCSASFRHASKTDRQEVNFSHILTSKMNSDTTRHEKLEKGAEDFANRFEGVMKELANG